MLVNATVLANDRMGAPAEGLRRLVLRGISQAQPGQFLHIRVSTHLEPLLRRPLSIAGWDQVRQEVTLLYRVQGRGTQLLAGVCPGEELSVLGPLGQGFALPSAGKLWLVAGGIGAFPLFALAQAAVAQGLGVRLFWGGSQGKFLESAGLADWQRLGIPLHLATLDGSLGSKGMVTEALQVQLGKLASAETVRVATCGPKGMMQAVVEQCLPLGIPVEVSLEERMGCGVGACLGCSVTLRSGLGGLTHKKVCQDGPVFRGEEVVWDA